MRQSLALGLFQVPARVAQVFVDSLFTTFQQRSTAFDSVRQFSPRRHSTQDATAAHPPRRVYIRPTPAHASPAARSKPSPTSRTDNRYTSRACTFSHRSKRCRRIYARATRLTRARANAMAENTFRHRSARRRARAATRARDDDGARRERSERRPRATWQQKDISDRDIDNNNGRSRILKYESTMYVYEICIFHDNVRINTYIKI